MISGKILAQRTESPVLIEFRMNNTVVMLITYELKTIYTMEIQNKDNLENVIGFEALYESMYKCKCGVMWKTSVASFVLNGLERCLTLERQLKSGTYKGQDPVKFMVTHPKPREIISITFRDRVYQRSLNDNAIYPKISKRFIQDNCACQKNKGTDYARDRLQEFLRSFYRKHKLEGYVLQCDIHGYYPNMRHDVAKQVFQENLPEDVYLLAEDVLSNQYAGEVGYNPGSQMIQIAGISVLDKLDHFIKERLHIKYYIRYMDDFILIHEDKEYLKYCKEELAKELDKIGFTFNEKKTKVYPLSKGILFLGFTFHISDTGKVYKILNPDNVKSERKKLYRLVELAKKGERTKAKVDECYAGWRNHASKGNSFHLLKRMDEYYESLWKGDNQYVCDSN